MDNIQNHLYRYCVGCGLCRTLGKAEIMSDNDGFYHPITGDQKWLETICPAAGTQCKEMDASSIWGRHKGVYRGWSNDIVVRRKASSGGVISSVAIYLLEKKYVDSVIHIGSLYGHPTENQICFSTTKEEVLSRAGSRYSISHSLEFMSEIDLSRKYCVIAKPCEIAALRNYIKKNIRLEKSFPYLLSFFCMGTPSRSAQRDLLKALNTTIENCSELSYRGNGWPGMTIATNKDGSSSKMEYSQSWGRILGRDLMPACRFCVDGIGELADISCGDAWYISNNKPDFSEREGRNLVFARTSKGKQLIEDMIKEGIINIEEYDNFNEELKIIQKSQYQRRAFLKSRILGMKLLFKPHPHYENRLLVSYSKNEPFSSRMNSFLGTIKRGLKGKV